MRLKEFVEKPHHWITAWVTPQGKVMEFPTKHHVDAAVEIIKDRKNKDYDFEFDESEFILMYEGWVRAGIYVYDKQPGQAYMSMDENFVSKQALKATKLWLIKTFKKMTGEKLTTIYTENTTIPLKDFDFIVGL